MAVGFLLRSLAQIERPADGDGSLHGGVSSALGSSKISEEVERGFISKETVSRRHQAAQRSHSSSLSLSP